MTDKKLFKIISSILAAVIVLIGIVVNQELSGINLGHQASIPAEQRLEIDFLNIGQGDSILIKTPHNQKILIDGGPDMSILDQLGKNMVFFDKNIDVMILTHPHADHVSGLVEVLKRYDVGRIYYTGVAHTSPAFLEWLDAIKQSGAPLHIVSGQKSLEFADGVNLEFIYPLEDIAEKQFDELNNSSIVCKVTYKNKKFLFVGDAEAAVEKALIDSAVDLRSDVLKVGHHGSATSSTEEFLTAVDPEYAVVQVGQDNEFGHPSLTVIRRLERLGIEIFSNDLNGQVSVFSDGDNIEIVTEK
ncbi:MAG: ComEC/Rec2 family competence protein [Patescibacteria group bacterium]